MNKSTGVPVKLTRNHDYWTSGDVERVATAHSFSELAEIALKILNRMPQPIGQVCGPISTGGAGSLEANLRIFDQTIQRLIDGGKSIFDQMPFEDHFFRIIDEGWDTKHNNKLLTDFYVPIFESGHVSSMYFIPGWESSQGATWEHQQAQRLGMEIVYLSE